MKNLTPFIVALLLSGAAGLAFSGCDRDQEEASAEVVAPDEEAAEEPEDESSAELALDGDPIDLEKLPFYATGPVARVDGTDLSVDDFNQLIHEQVQRLHQALPPETVALMRTQNVDRLIDVHLIDTVLSQQEVEVSEADVEEHFQMFQSQFPDPATMEAFLAQQGVTVAEVRESMIKDVALERYLSTRYDLTVEDQEVRNFFDRHRDDLATPVLAHTRHILLRVQPGSSEEVRTAQAARIAEIRAQVDADGSNFESLARQYSESPTASRGGDMGPLYAPQMIPEYAEAIMNLQAGDISDPVQSRYGFHIIQVLEKEEGSAANFEELEERLRLEVRQQKRAEAFQKFLKEERERVEIEKFPENIKTNSAAMHRPPRNRQGLPALTPPSGGASPSAPEGRQLQVDPSLLQP